MLSLPIPFLFIITMTACLGTNTLRKEYSKKVFSSTGYFALTAASSFICMLLLWCFSGFQAAASRNTVLLGILFGIMTMSSTLLSLKALSMGPWAYTTVIISFSTLIPTLLCAAIWQEDFGIFQIIGILLMTVSLLFCVKTRQNDTGKKTFTWLLITLAATVLQGMIGVLQKVHQKSPYREEQIGFLLTAFAVSTVFSLILCFIRRNESTENPSFFSLLRDPALRIKLLGCFLLMGICIALNNYINLYLSGIINSAVFFPTVNGGNLVLVTILSVILYREKLTGKQVIGILCGILSVVSLCLH